MKNISVERVASWAKDVPELRVHPYLLAAMKEDKKIRHLVFSLTNGVSAIVAMNDPLVARHILGVYETNFRQRIREMCDTIEEKNYSLLYEVNKDLSEDKSKLSQDQTDILVFNQHVESDLRGFMKNLLKTSYDRLRSGRVEYSEREVKRYKWWRKEPYGRSGEKLILSKLTQRLEIIGEDHPEILEEILNHKISCIDSIYYPYTPVYENNKLMGFETSLREIVNSITEQVQESE